MYNMTHSGLSPLAFPGTDGLAALPRLRRRTRRALLYLAELCGRVDLQRRWLNANDLPLVDIDPRRIARCVTRSGLSRELISEGDWDLSHVAPLCQARLNETAAVEDIFAHDRHFRETAQYAQMHQAVARYRSGECTDPAQQGAYWCRSEEDIARYFETLSRAYHGIRRHGYKTQQELARQHPDESRHPDDEMQVLITRDGEVVLGYGGSHRLAIVQLLGLASVPVRVVALHPRWLDHFRQRKHSLRSCLHHASRAAADISSTAHTRDNRSR